MLLALDIGNSTIVAAVFSGKTKLAEQTVSSTQQRTEEETWSIVTSLLQASNTSPTELEGVGISSVVPFHTNLFTTLFKEKLNLEPLIINGLLDIGMKISYDSPMSLGADRICSAVAAYSKFGRRLPMDRDIDAAESGPLIIVDFGTATTYGVIGSNGDFLGGAISLGVRSTAEAMSRRAAQLPEIELRVPPSPICRNTIESMQAGIMFGAVDAVEGMVKRIRSELGVKARVIATGGLSTTMAKHTSIIDVCVPSLVLEGVRLIYERVRIK